MNTNRLKVFFNFMSELALLSKCVDKKQAAIIVDADLTQIYSIGLNGGASKGIDCLCTLGGKYTCIHAEAQAIAKAKCDLSGCTMLCTMSPCVTCAAMIINSGIKSVIFRDAYHDKNGIYTLEAADVTVASFAQLGIS